MPSTDSHPCGGDRVTDPDPSPLVCRYEPVGTERIDPRATNSLAGDVVEAIGSATGVEPVQLPRVYDAVEPAALYALFCGRTGTERTVMGFAFDRWYVTARSDGRIRVFDASADA